MLKILDNTLVNLISKMKGISINLDVKVKFDEELHTNFKQGVYENNRYEICIDNQFTIICRFFIKEIKYAHLFDRIIYVQDIIILDGEELIGLSFNQYNVLHSSLKNLVLIENTIQ